MGFCSLVAVVHSGSYPSVPVGILIENVSVGDPLSQRTRDGIEEKTGSGDRKELGDPGSGSRGRVPRGRRRAEYMGFCGQAAAGQRECVERPERRTARVIKVAALSPSLVWPLESLVESGSAGQSGVSQIKMG